MNHKNFIFILVILSLLSACTESNPAYNPDPFLPGECRVGSEVTENFEAFERPEKLDILIVVDNSGDVEDLQKGVAEALPDFLESLVDAGIDVEVATATADGTVGPGLAEPGKAGDGCSGNTTKVAKSSKDGWTKVAACNIQQGEDGDDYQQSLQVVESLFFDVTSTELGFFRTNARRLVLIVSNQDDCSHDGSLAPSPQARRECLDNPDALRDIDELVDHLSTATTTPEGLKVAVFSGPPSEDSELIRPVCSSTFGAAYSAKRLLRATSIFDDQGHFANACVEHFGPTFDTLRTRLLQPRAMTLCPAKPLAHEPLSVSGVTDDQRSAIRLGSDGFVFDGVTDGCENGALRFAPKAVEGVTSIEINYCVE